jgi:DNA polymerase-3 subunit epsilon
VFDYHAAVQLTLDAADRLVALVEEQRGAVPAEEAARALYRLERLPAGMARALLADVVDADARLVWRGDAVALGVSPADAEIGAATFVVVDVETTGLRPRGAAICEIGAVRLRGLEVAATFETLADPGAPLPRPVADLTGLDDADLVGAPSPTEAVRRFLTFAYGPGEAGSAAGSEASGPPVAVVAHNARFDLAFLDPEVAALTGRRLAAPVVDTVWLARRLLGDRTPRAGLAALAHFFGTATEPCHRALPDALATAEVLVALAGIAQERGARTVADLCRLSEPRTRRVFGKRSLAFGAPTRPGVYLFHDARDAVLYVGKARDLRARLRSYFAGGRQRPAVEAALQAVERIEWRVTGSELEAALLELRLIRELRPPANARAARPDRYVYLRRRGEGICVSSTPTPLGPIRSRRRAELAARALAGAPPEELAALAAGAPLPRLRARLHRLAGELRFEDAARLRDRVEALEEVIAGLAELERLRRAELCLLVPAAEPGHRRAFFVAGGRIASARTLPPGLGAQLELAAGVAEAEAAAPSLAPEDADELLLVASFLRRPPPELEVRPLRPAAAA